MKLEAKKLCPGVVDKRRPCLEQMPSCRDGVERAAGRSQDVRRLQEEGKQRKGGILEEEEKAGNKAEDRGRRLVDTGVLGQPEPWAAP